ncbi:Uncharacterised protein [Acinetobacter baumannii]|nr:Uncharacterised protein [Acinetobacter baumannii]
MKLFRIGVRDLSRHTNFKTKLNQAFCLLYSATKGMSNATEFKLMRF